MPDVGILMSVSALTSSGGTPPGVTDRVNAIVAGLTQQNQGTAVVAPPVFCRQNPWDPVNYGSGATNVVKLSPSVIFSSCYPTMAQLANLTTTIPIVYAGLFNANAAQQYQSQRDLNAYYFVNVGGGQNNNITGFVSHQFEVCQQWPVFLARIAPTVTNAVVLYETGGSGVQQYNEIVANKGSLTISSIDLTKINSTANLDAAVAKIIKGATCGLIVTSSALTASITADIVSIAAKYNLPAVYPNRLYVKNGGLISFGADLLNLYQLAGFYLGRLLNGYTTLPDQTNLPAVVPNSDLSDYELAINVTTAGSLGALINANNLAALLKRADWVYK
jgi:putative ABC transport system substrate-binding protein